MARGKATDIGEDLVEKGLLSNLQLEEARRESELNGQPLQRTLVEMDLITEEDLVKLLSGRFKVPMMSLNGYLIDSGTLEAVPESFARKSLLIPLFKVKDTLTVAMVDPLDIEVLDELRQITQCNIDPMIATETDIRKALDQHYGARGSMEDVVKSIEEEQPDLSRAAEGDFDAKKLQDIAEEAPVIKLVNIMIMEAVKAQASDVHIEPEAGALRVRYRIDGVLQETYSPPKHLQPAIISRIKIMAGMDIAQKRIPQDGRILAKMENREIDLRVSIQPTIHGENTVIRILDSSASIMDLERLGFAERENRLFSELIRRSHGIILVTGPTGSGKTTTLYSAINMINTVDKNIMTVEEPVEYHMELVRQTQVDRKVGVDFANALRSILRQDPDIIFVGEIRDRETADMAVRSALTGHLVFSTLHTNDAPGALTRLVDIGIESYLVASSVMAVLAQRLVRKICSECKEPFSPSRAALLDWGLDEKGKYSFYRGKGCKKCRDSGYSGRIGIFELMIMDDVIRERLMSGAPSTALTAAAVAGGMITLRQDGLRKALDGVTTLEEVARVAL